MPLQNTVFNKVYNYFRLSTATTDATATATATIDL
jgi:hypothetical protein